MTLRNYNIVSNNCGSCERLLHARVHNFIFFQWLTLLVNIVYLDYNEIILQLCDVGILMLYIFIMHFQIWPNCNVRAPLPIYQWPCAWTARGIELMILKILSIIVINIFIIYIYNFTIRKKYFLNCFFVIPIYFEYKCVRKDI